MKLGFNPKDVIASIVNVIAAYGVMSCGGNADMAKAGALQRELSTALGLQGLP